MSHSSSREPVKCSYEGRHDPPPPLAARPHTNPFHPYLQERDQQENRQPIHNQGKCKLDFQYTRYVINISLKPAQRPHFPSANVLFSADTPKFVWNEPALEPVYVEVRNYLDINQRYATSCPVVDNPWRRGSPLHLLTLPPEKSQGSQSKIRCGCRPAQVDK